MSQFLDEWYISAGAEMWYTPLACDIRLTPSDIFRLSDEMFKNLQTPPSRWYGNNPSSEKQPHLKSSASRQLPVCSDWMGWCRGFLPLRFWIIRAFAATQKQFHRNVSIQNKTMQTPLFMILHRYINSVTQKRNVVCKQNVITSPFFIFFRRNFFFNELCHGKVPQSHHKIFSLPHLRG